MHFDDFRTIFKSWNHAENRSYKHSISLNDKFSRLFTSQNSVYPSDFPPVNQNAVVNLSNSALYETQCSVLKVNSNLAISKSPSFPQLIAPIEKAFKNSRLTDTQKENLRHLILANVNFNFTNFESNLTHAEKKALTL